MSTTNNKYLKVCFPAVKAACNAYSPMYRMMASLFILITGAILKSIHIDGADVIIYIGVMATFIMALSIFLLLPEKQ